MCVKYIKQDYFYNDLPKSLFRRDVYKPTYVKLYNRILNT